MGFLWSAVRKDIQRWRRDPVALALWIGIPLIIGSLMTVASGGSGGPKPQAHLLVADEDGSFLSEMLTGAFGRVGDALIRAEEVEREEGRERIEKGDGSALLVIPKGFGDAILKEERTELLLLTNPSQRILPGIVEETLSMLAEGVFYLHRILGRELREIVTGPPDNRSTFPDADMARISVSINKAMRRLEKYLFPPVIELETAVDEKEDEKGLDLSYAVLLLPGVLFMALFFTAQGLSEDVWKERDSGTLRRVLSTPHGIAIFLAGKVVSGTLVMVGICFLGLVIGTAYFGLSLTDLPLALVWSGVSGAVLLVVMMLIQNLASSRRGGSILTSAVMFPLLMIGGSFFPFEAMPEWMATVGRHTPNGWALDQLKRILLYDVDSASLAAGFVGLFASTAVLFWLSVGLLRRAFAGR